MLGLDPRRLVFIDATGVNTKMTRGYGRAPRGERVVAKAPRGHWKSTTFPAAPRGDGLTAPLVIDGALTGELFLAYARQQLAPALRPGDIVTLDNLSCHKTAGVRAAIEAVAGLENLLGRLTDRFSPTECLNYFRHCGYATGMRDAL
jgi:hypothetical protein